MLSAIVTKQKTAPRLSGKKSNTKQKMTIYIALAGAYLLAVMLAGLFMSPELYGVNYADKFLPPSLSHLFGTDFMGRDMFWRSIKGLS